MRRLQNIIFLVAFIVLFCIGANHNYCYSQTVSTGFDVNVHGYSFANSDLPGFCYTLEDLSKLRYDPNGEFCNNGWALCGGMSLSAGERYLKGLTSSGLTVNQALPIISDAQFRTLTASTVTKFLNWIASPDVGHASDINRSITYKMKEDWNIKIQPWLDAQKPIVLGLVFDKTAELIDFREVGALGKLFDQHQVLGIGYTKSGNDIELYAYDPNYPNDTLIMSFTLNQFGVNQRLSSGNSLSSSRRDIRGVMFVRSIAGNVKIFLQSADFTPQDGDYNVDWPGPPRRKWRKSDKEYYNITATLSRPALEDFSMGFYIKQEIRGWFDKEIGYAFVNFNDVSAEGTGTFWLVGTKKRKIKGNSNKNGKVATLYLEPFEIVSGVDIHGWSLSTETFASKKHKVICKDDPSEDLYYFIWWEDKNFKGKSHKRILYPEDYGKCLDLVHNDKMKSIKFYGLPGWKLYIYDNGDCKKNDDWGVITFPENYNNTVVEVPLIGKQGPSSCNPPGSYEFHYHNGLPGEVSAVKFTYEGITFGYNYEGIQGYIYTSQIPGTVPLYMLYNTKAGDHFYTISPDGANPIGDWQPKGIIGYVYSESGQADRLPLYRWYKPSPDKPKKTDHFYTTSRSEPTSGSGYVFEGIECYVPKSNISGTVPFYRWYKGSINDHFYTRSTSEPTAGSGYVSEGIQCNIFPNQSLGTVPLYRLYSDRAKDHFYTISSKGASSIGSWKPEGIAGWVYSGPAPSNRQPLYRWYKPSPNKPIKTDHFYTTSTGEPASNSGYVFEGIECYLPVQGSVGSVPLYRYYNPTLNDHYYTISLTH